jgi:hypothetical protein
MLQSDMGSSLLQDIAHAAVARCAERSWDVVLTQGDFWCHLSPSGDEAAEIAQGWKLHVSATPLSAAVVLARAAAILVSAGCSFKFAATLDNVASLVSAEYDRGGGGKFITVYPSNDDQFRALAQALDEATAGLPGPVILSDKQLRPGSLVHYRYGAFSGTNVFTNEGKYENRLVTPDGVHVPDRRLGWFSPPDWAPPAPVDEAASDPADESRSVLLHDRFVVSKAVRTSLRGGVYRARDRQTDDDVIVKQARAHTAVNLSGFDAQDRLRHEDYVLRLLSETGLTPKPIALFDQQGDLFLAVEQIDGLTLRSWAQQFDHEDVDAVRTMGEMAAHLVEMLSIFHGQGLVVRDFTPNNVMVEADGNLRFVDLEAVVEPGTVVSREYTLGYVAPEYQDTDKVGAAPGQTTDLYSLGASIFFAASAIDPFLIPDDAEGKRSNASRLDEWLRAMAVDNPALRALAPAILGLMADDVDLRWSIEQARAFLAKIPNRQIDRSERNNLGLKEAARSQLLKDGLGFVVATMDRQGKRLWPSSGFGESSDRCNVQYGAAGVLAVLARAAADGAAPGGPGREVIRPAVTAAARWVEETWPLEPTILPGLHFGRSGTAWALFDAGRVLEDEDMTERALDLALRIPLIWPNPDVCHGTTGAGMLQHYLWQATGDQRFADRAIQCADALRRMADRSEERVLWPIPKDFDSELAGLVHYGFAHGVAGIGNFLLATGVEFAREGDVELARLAGRTLADAAVTFADGGALWPSGEEEAAPMLHWCSGSSGVGTFLIRLWLATGEDRYRELAEMAAYAVWRNRWNCSPAACHGLAGNAQFLLDVSAALGESKYRAWAEDLVECAHTRAFMRDGFLVVPNESMSDVTVDYQTGLAGFLDLLLRLQDGGARLWMPELQSLAKRSNTPLHLAAS